MNGCNSEKKAFERLLDDLVAAGLDKSMSVLIDQVEYILKSEQKATDYDPIEPIMDLEPTKACVEAVHCLASHTQLVGGAADTHTTEVFYTEVGLRFYATFTKHLKTMQISEQGGFRLIGDLNAYYEWAASLGVAEAAKYFSALKELGHIYVVSPTSLRDLMHDANRYRGVIGVEDIYEFVQLRKDYRKIKPMVDDKCTFM